MAQAAIGFAKAMRRRRMMACTTSIGPGATNMVTAAAVAHVDRLPVLLLPGDVFASRRPDPVLQQVEDFADGTVSANDCFRPVSRYFDRITRPEQMLTALPRALAVLTDPAECGPGDAGAVPGHPGRGVRLSRKLLRAARCGSSRRPRPDATELAAAAALLRAARGAADRRRRRRACTPRRPRRSTVRDQRTAFRWQKPRPARARCRTTIRCNLGAIGVTGTAAANRAAAEADVVLAVGTRLQDFTTGSRALFRNPARQFIG